MENAGMAPVPEDKLKGFFNGEREFLAVHRPAGSMDIMKINGNPTDVMITRKMGRVELRYCGRFSEDEHKIIRMIDLWIAENNFHGAKKNLRTEAVLPLTRVMEMLGKTPTDANKRKFKERLMGVIDRKNNIYKSRGILKNISDAFIDIDDGHGTRLHSELGTGTFSVSIPKDVIRFEVSNAYTVFQNTAPLGQYSWKTLYLTGLAFLIADKLQDQYFRDGNRTRQTHNIISITKILELCSDYVPDFQEVQARDRGHWKKRIRDPIVRALNQIQETGLFNWKYCGMRKKELTDIASREDDYYLWSEMYITYTLIPDEPEAEGRLNRKKEKREASIGGESMTRSGKSPGKRQGRKCDK